MANHILYIRVLFFNFILQALCCLFKNTLQKSYLWSFAYFSKGYGARKPRLYSRVTNGKKDRSGSDLFRNTFI